VVLIAAFAGQAIGIKEVEEGIWLVSFMDYDLGYIDLEEKTLQPLHRLAQKCKPCLRNVLPWLWSMKQLAQKLSTGWQQG
jgi:hypothetical protein